MSIASRAVTEFVYDRTFFSIATQTGAASARRVVPFIAEWLRPESVVVGCGEARGSPNSQRPAVGSSESTAGTSIPDGCSIPRRLRSPRLGRPLSPLFPDELFDLAVCLEVAEHVSPTRAGGLVDDLVALSDCVLFSAAVPGQGATATSTNNPTSIGSADSRTEAMPRRPSFAGNLLPRRTWRAGIAQTCCCSSG